jgi:flavin-binding protein dodecin
MTEPVYKIVELVGTSDQSISKAIDRAIEKASSTVRHLGWFEVVQIRGSIDQGKVRQYQVTVKAGFTLEDTSVRGWQVWWARARSPAPHGVPPGVVSRRTFGQDRGCRHDLPPTGYPVALAARRRGRDGRRRPRAPRGETRLREIFDAGS